MAPVKENKVQADLIKELKVRYDGCVIVKNDPNYIQGFPDLLVLHNKTWAALEVKASETAKHQPNQDHYVGKLDGMSYASFVSPENKETVLKELDKVFG